MSCCDKDKHCHPYPIEPAPFAPGGCDPHPPCPPRPPRPPYKPGCPPSQYIGSRYVPIFADPIEWDKSRAYESLTIVVHEGESYTSRCNVGPGIDITNTTYWAKTGAYNAILEQYRNEVGDLSSQVTGFAKDNAEFREKIDGYDKDNAAMKETVSSYTEKVDKLTERVTADEADINAVQATTAQHTKDIADLKAKDADLQQQISANDTDIANINDHQTEQDSRLDSIEAVNAKQETAIAKNTSDIAAEVSRASAAEVANGKLIARNAEELAKHATELTDHEKRITALETDNTTNKADIRANAAKNTAQDAEIEQVRDLANHKVDQSTFDAADKLNVKYNTDARRLIDAHELLDSAVTTRQALNSTVVVGSNTENTGPGLYGKVSLASLALKSEVDTAQAAADKANTNIGDWTTGHPGQTISQCATSQETELEEHAGEIAKLEADKADKTTLNQYVTTTTYNAGQKTQDDRIAALETGKVPYTVFPYRTRLRSVKDVDTMVPVEVLGTMNNDCVLIPLEKNVYLPPDLPYKDPKNWVGNYKVRFVGIKMNSETGEVTDAGYLGLPQNFTVRRPDDTADNDFASATSARLVSDSMVMISGCSITDYGSVAYLSATKNMPAQVGWAGDIEIVYDDGHEPG